jgi:hypothetical protein
MSPVPEMVGLLDKRIHLFAHMRIEQVQRGAEKSKRAQRDNSYWQCQIKPSNGNDIHI